MELWRLYSKQLAALKILGATKFSLMIGQGRSSKTTLAVWYLFKRAWEYPGTSHIILRNTLASAIDGVWDQTVKEVIAHFYPVLPSIPGFVVNESSHSIKFPNGSRILLRGLDTPERATKVLSQQFATVVFDEAQTILYTYFALLLTRLPQPVDVDYQVKVICTANYAPKTHWTRKFFVEKTNADTGAPHVLDTDYIQFSTADNKSIDAEDYIETLRAAGDRRAVSMCAGDDWYEEIEGALWEQEDVQRATALPLDDYDDIVVSFDPAVTHTTTSDAHGVCVAGRIGEDYHILKAYEKKADINVIAKEVASLYHTYGCSKLIYEVNQGADWIEALINTHDPDVYCEGVRAKKGKILRAEPAAALYKNKLVYHCQAFRELEDQMVTYVGTGASPNALDALVYAVKYLKEFVKYVDPDDCL